MRHPLTIAALALLAVGPVAARPTVVRTLFPTPDVVIATEVVRPPAPGPDAAPLIQTAINRVHTGGGGVVFLPAGRYRLATPLVIRDGVALRGDWAPPTTNGWELGTLLMPVAGRGTEAGPPAIGLGSNCGVRDLAIWYPDQDAVHPVPYPWTIATLKPESGSTANPTVLNVTLVNPYRGVCIGPNFNFLFMVRNLYGTPLKTGLSIDACYDIGRIHEVRFSPRWWSEARLPGAPRDPAALKRHLLAEATGLDLGRHEWGYVYGCQVDGYRVGIDLRPGDGTMNGVLFGCTVRACGTALQLRAVSTLGLSVTGCTLQSSGPAVMAPASCDGVAQFNACTLASSDAPAVLWQGSGALSLQNCTVTRWKGVAVRVDGGSATVAGTAFQQSGSHILLGKSVNRALVAGNTFAGKPSVVSRAEWADVQVSHKPIAFARPNTALMDLPPDPRPTSNRLFDVTDYGAAPTVADNTAAISAALAAAGKAGGGTVYVPAGVYRLVGTLVVPGGVELRGCFDTPHHTLWAGSALLTTWGKGRANATPFIRLKSGSGLRGLTIWYPDQGMTEITPYPWAVQGLGPRCWVMHLNIANAYQGVDFWTYPSDGHLVRYLDGSYYSKGLFVSKCRGKGWIDDVHYNPHFSFWTDKRLVPVPNSRWDATIEYVRANLTGVALGRCEDEQVLSTFLYAGHDGMAFRSDGGGPNARVIHHGTDTGQRCVAIEAAGPRGIEMVNTQLVPLGKQMVGGVVVTPSFAGNARLFGLAMWPAATGGVIEGKGDVLIQCMNNLSGTWHARGGRLSMQNGRFSGPGSPDVEVTGGAVRLALLTGAAGALETSGPSVRTLNAAEVPARPMAGADHFNWGWEAGEPECPPATIGGAGLWAGGTTGSACRATTDDAHSGSRSLRLAGRADDATHSYVYFKVADGPIAVYPDTVLSFWIKPENALGRQVGVDLTFSDGTNLRSANVMSSTNDPFHPAVYKGEVGKWTKVETALGRYLPGRIITEVLLAYDTRGGVGPFSALLDDLEIIRRPRRR